MFIQTDTLEKNGAHGAAMHVHKYWGCLQICWQRAENTQVFRRPADKERSILMTNACFCKVVWRAQGQNRTKFVLLYIKTLKESISVLWRLVFLRDGFCLAVSTKATIEDRKSFTGKHKNISRKKEKKDKFQYKHSLIIQGRGLVAWYATAACLSMLISCNGPSTSSVSKNLCSQHR